MKMECLLEKLKVSFYFDDNRQPISLDLGQYGVHLEYDPFGRVILKTYLDEEGNPIVTSKGYTTVKNTFYNDDSIKTEFYFDQRGYPVELSEGQYGLRIIDGKTRYLNKYGEELFNIRNYLYSNRWWAFLLGLSLIAISYLSGRKQNIVFLGLYVCCILYMTVMFRESIIRDYSFELFRSYKKALSSEGARSDIMSNIWLFFPMGFILYRISPKTKVLLVAVLLSVFIEVCQYFCSIGFCELDDVFNNSMGSILGYCTAVMLMRVKNMRIKKHLRKCH